MWRRRGSLHCCLALKARGKAQTEQSIHLELHISNPKVCRIGGAKIQSRNRKVCFIFMECSTKSRALYALTL